MRFSVLIIHYTCRNVWRGGLWIYKFFEIHFHIQCEPVHIFRVIGTRNYKKKGNNTPPHPKGNFVLGMLHDVSIARLLLGYDRRNVLGSQTFVEYM